MATVCRCRKASSLLRYMSSSSTSITNSKIPILYDKPNPNSDSTTTNDTIQLLSWGRAGSGQLGGDTEVNRLYPTAVASLHLPISSLRLAQTPGKVSYRDDSADKGKINVGISCGLFHSGLLVDGKVWIWGKGDAGRLGFGDELSRFRPTLNTSLDSIKCIALGGIHSTALDSARNIFTWGYGGFGALGHSVYTNEFVPRLVEGPWKDKITHLTTSGTHTAVVTESGEVYTWGRDEGDGRLGIGPGRGHNEGGGLSIPLKVKSLPSPMAAVYCGGFFTMALSKEGQLWSWGANSNYELGRGDKIGGWKPQLIQSLQDVRIIQIASGGYHSLALTDEGKVLSWGHGGHGQLGHPSIQNQKVPTIIEALVNEQVVDIACGGSSSAAITDKGKLFMWGNSRDFQLGVPGLPECQKLPVEVNFLTEDDGLGPHQVLSVAIGASHAMCLVSRSG